MQVKIKTDFYSKGFGFGSVIHTFEEEDLRRMVRFDPCHCYMSAFSGGHRCALGRALQAAIRQTICKRQGTNNDVVLIRSDRVTE